MKFKYYLKITLLGVLLLTILWPQMATAQQITGRVYEQTSGEVLPAQGAFIHCLGESNGVVSDSQGYFIMNPCVNSTKFVVEYVASVSDTISIVNGKSNYRVDLKPTGEMLKAATAKGKKQRYGMRSIDPKTTINLNEREFQKAACCNLAESFENSPAIDVSFGDAVTGTKQIKMLGLDGFYSMISREYMPSVRLLNSYYGMSFIPAAWVTGIQITKGAGSVVNGYESMAGQINIEMRKPFDSEKIMVDQFVSESGRTETDVMYRHDFSKYVATSILVRSAFRPIRQDRNDDGFLDNPTGRQFQYMNRWQFYTPKGFEGQASISYNDDRKEAGQLKFYEDGDGPNPYYGIDIDNQQFDAWAKVGKAFKDKPYKSFGSQFGYNSSNIRSNYGSESAPNYYQAEAQSFYANLMYQSIIGTTIHGYKLGATFLFDEMSEQVQTKNLINVDRSEYAAGAYMEYSFIPSEKINVVLGLRGDYNNLYGFFVTPRLHSKFILNKERTTVRISGGQGRRTSNIFGQNQQMFASAREIQILTLDALSSKAYGLDQEVAFNTGFSIEHKMKWGLWPATLLVDYFYTNFSNEVVFDRETDSLVRFYNMNNGTRANSFQAQLDFKPLRRTEIRAAYRLFDVYTKYTAGTFEKPFVARHRSFINLTQTNRNKWQFSSTLQWYGKQRIPGTTLTPEVNHEFSPSFFQLNAQLSKQITSNFEAYLGAENLLNYKQDNPIANASNPFDKGFDAALVWGPVFGRMIYGGIRWRLKDH